MSQMMDKVRIEQLIRGAAFDSDLILLQLRLRERKDQPPTFLELLNELKTAEENELARRRIRTSVKSINLKTDDNLESDVVKQLRAELQELKATKCRALENTGKVIQKLVRSLRRAKAEGSKAKEDPVASRGPDSFSK